MSGLRRLVSCRTGFQHQRQQMKSTPAANVDAVYLDGAIAHVIEAVDEADQRKLFIFAVRGP